MTEKRDTVCTEFKQEGDMFCLGSSGKELERSRSCIIGKNIETDFRTFLSEVIKRDEVEVRRKDQVRSIRLETEVIL